MPKRFVFEICAGTGGQSLGLERAGFHHTCAVEIDRHAAETLRSNRPAWNIREDSVHNIRGSCFRGVDLFAGGVPCPPFSIAGKGLGGSDERDLFPAALRLIEECRPKAVLFENVRGLATKRFERYRIGVQRKLQKLGFESDWRILNASDFQVPQLRPRFVLVALRPTAYKRFRWPEPSGEFTTVAETIGDLMAAGGWPGAEQWRKAAHKIAPTLVGGSKKHGGPDLGPTRAKRQWLDLRVDGMGLADAPPSETFPVDGNPKLTVRMAARLQGFPDTWTFAGRKTASYRQVGNGFPPPVAAAVGTAIMAALESKRSKQLDGGAIHPSVDHLSQEGS